MLLSRGARRVVLRRARPDIVLLAHDMSAGRNGVGVEVRKGLQRPAVRVPGANSGRGGNRSRPSRSPQTELGAVDDVHEVAIPRGLKV
jgi:hypothetical protein